MLYFAYGSNLHRADMLARCPAALPLGRARLPDHALVFRSWADVAPAPGRAVVGGLWRITPACAAALDAYEDVAGGLYRRWILPVLPEDGDDQIIGDLDALFDLGRQALDHAAGIGAIPGRAVDADATARRVQIDVIGGLHPGQMAAVGADHLTQDPVLEGDEFAATGHQAACSTAPVNRPVRLFCWPEVISTATIRPIRCRASSTWTDCR